MSRTPVDQLIPRADKHIIRAFPRVAQRLESQVDELDRAEMDTFLKMLPGAIERFQAVVTPVNDLHESVEGAILQLVASFPRQSFAPSNAPAVESASQFETSNTSVEAEETAGSVVGAELPNGSDTSQELAPNTLPHNELAIAPGNGGEFDSQQAGPRNPRVRTASRLQGRKAGRRAQQASGETANDRG